MFIDRLLGRTNAPLLESAMRFSAKRHDVIAENVANISTPGYVQKDLDLPAFQTSLRKALRQRDEQGMPISLDLPSSVNANANILFHDGADRSPERLMSDMASNAMRHNLYVELMRKQYDSINNALRERIA